MNETYIHIHLVGGMAPNHGLGGDLPRCRGDTALYINLFWGYFSQNRTADAVMLCLRAGVCVVEEEEGGDVRYMATMERCAITHTRPAVSSQYGSDVTG